MSDNSFLKRTISGVVAVDPLHDAPIGTQLNISADLFTTSSSFKLSNISNWDFFNGVVVAIHFGGNRSQRITGSGVLVAPGVALTARHVIEPELEQIMNGSTEIICTGIAASGWMIWKCHQITLIDHTDDLALLINVSASALPDVLRQAAITTRLPRDWRTIDDRGRQARHSRSSGN